MMLSVAALVLTLTTSALAVEPEHTHGGSMTEAGNFYYNCHSSTDPHVSNTLVLDYKFTGKPNAADGICKKMNKKTGKLYSLLKNKDYSTDYSDADKQECKAGVQDFLKDTLCQVAGKVWTGETVGKGANAKCTYWNGGLGTPACQGDEGQFDLSKTSNESCDQTTYFLCTYLWENEVEEARKGAAATE